MTDVNNVIATFKSRLAAGHYKELSGARRGIGKFQGIEDADRKKMLVIAERHFAAGAPAVSAPVAEVASAAPKAKRGRKPKAVVEGAAPEAPKARRGRKPATAASTMSLAEDANQQLGICEKAVDQLSRIGDRNVDVAVEMTAAKECIGRVIRNLRSTLGEDITAPAPQALVGHVVPQSLPAMPPNGAGAVLGAPAHR
jgi:hypothetical protein